MSFTTVDQVKSFLNREELTTEQTVLVQMLIELIDGVICNYCGWAVLATAYTSKKLDGNGLTELDLRAFPLNAVTEVLIDGVDVLTSVDPIVTEGILTLTTESGLVFTAGRRNVVVSYSAGFDEDAIPTELARDWAALQYAANYLVTINFTRIDAENIGVSEEKFNQVEVKYDKSDIPELVKRVLDRFRLISIY